MWGVSTGLKWLLWHRASCCYWHAFPWGVARYLKKKLYMHLFIHSNLCVVKIQERKACLATSLALGRLQTWCQRTRSFWSIATELPRERGIDLLDKQARCWIYYMRKVSFFGRAACVLMEELESTILASGWIVSPASQQTEQPPPHTLTLTLTHTLT